MTKGMIPENYFYDNKSLKGKLNVIKEELEKHCVNCSLYMNSNLELCVMCDCIDAKINLENIIKCEEFK